VVPAEKITNIPVSASRILRSLSFSASPLAGTHDEPGQAGWGHQKQGPGRGVRD